ncbi:NADPH quinone reductase MdaB, partial [Klebsiella oxytoca]
VEIEKFIWADTIIYQMPGWCMMMPWKVKKYMDEVYTYGHGKLYENDGRTRHDPRKHYGSGGLLQGKQYM